MSNFDVQYNFIAIDRFTKVARKIQKEATKIASTLGKDTKSFATNAQALTRTTKHLDKTAKSVANVGTVAKETATKTNKGMSSIVQGVKKGTQAFTSLTEHAAKLGDSLAFKGYIQFMNVGLPMMLAGKLGIDYADQMETAKNQMDVMFGKQKNYAKLSKQINQQASQLSQHTRFNRQEIIGTSAQIGVMTNNLKLAKDLTPMALGYSLLTKTAPLAASQKLVQAVRSGGALAGTGIVLPKGEGAAMAQMRYQMLKQRLNPKMMQLLKKDSDSASAALHKMMGQMQKLTGTLLQDAAPALESMAKSIKSILTPIINFMNAHQKLTGEFVKGAILAMSFTMGITLLGAAITAIAMPFEILVKTLAIASAAVKLFGAASVKVAAESSEAAASELASSKELGKIPWNWKGAAALGVAAGSLGVIGAGAHVVNKIRKKQYLSETDRLAYVRAHGYDGKTGKGAIIAYAQEKSLESGGASGGGGLGIMGMAGSATALTPVQHKIDMEIKVNQEGKVTNATAKGTGNIKPNITLSTGLNLGVNMAHAHG